MTIPLGGASQLISGRTIPQFYIRDIPCTNSTYIWLTVPLIYRCGNLIKLMVSVKKDVIIYIPGDSTPNLNRLHEASLAPAAAIRANGSDPGPPKGPEDQGRCISCCIL